MSDLDDLVAAGVYDPEAADAPARLALLEYLLGLGISLPEIARADEEQRLLSLAALHALRPDSARCTFAEAVERAGIDPDFARRIWRAAGFPDPRPIARNYSDRDVELLRFAAGLVGSIDAELVVQLVRTMGESMLRLAEAEAALLRSTIEAPLVADNQLLDVARKYEHVVERLLPRVVDAMDGLHRRHLEMVARRYSNAGTNPTPENLAFLAVGFADLAGYTGLAQELDAAALGMLLSTFEAITGDLIAAAGAHVVKRIGDAVMFVTAAPGIACALALDIVDTCAAHRLPRLRVGVAFGEVMVRQGDFHGSTVNLAARLVSAAEPGVILTDASLADRLGSLANRYTFHAAGRYTLAGYAEPVEAFQLLRVPGR
jgi:class 3 adenylate cyclase